MMVSFNTSYYEKGVLVSRRGRIAIHYLKCWFWIDLLSCFPYEEVAAWAIESDTNSAAIASSLRMLRFARLAKVARLLRLAKLKVLFDRLEELLSLSATVAAIASFLRLNFFVLFWSHWLGCIFHFIA
jgi:hyperpolarization activated cyclic nucleotide-gated potassium channel 2